MTADTSLEYDAAPAAAHRRGAARAVAAELEAIFPERATPTERPRRAAVQRLTPRASGRRDRRAAGIGAVVAAGLAGLAVGLAVVHRPQPTPAAAPAASPRGAQIALAAPAAASTTAPPAVPPIGPLDPPSSTLRREAAPAHVVATRAARPAARPAVVRAATRRAPVHAGSRCDRFGGEARARCAYPAVIAADRRLRTAYAHATRAGVPRAALVRYRDRWADLRHGAQRYPFQTISAYSDMARDLDRLSRRARS